MRKKETWQFVGWVLVLWGCLFARAALADNLQDLKDWHKEGLPTHVSWNLYSAQDSLTHIKAGRRTQFTVFLPSAAEAINPKYWTNKFAPQVARLDEAGALGVPLVLRGNNLATELSSTWNRPTNTIDPVTGKPFPWTEMLPESPVCWRVINGVLNDSGAADNLGPSSNWSHEGALLGNSYWARELQKHIANPATVLHLDNNELHYDNSPRKDAWSTWLNGEKVTEKAPDGTSILPKRKWRPDIELRASSVRMADRVRDVLGYDSDPLLELVPWENRRCAQYLAYFAALDGAAPEGWKGKLFTAAYTAGRAIERQSPKFVTDEVGVSPEHRYRDGAGTNFYLNYGGTTPGDMTDPKLAYNFDFQRPAWEWIEARYPKAFRTVFTWINGKGALSGALAGQHAVVTPEIWESSVGWALWSCRKPGRAVMLIDWRAAADKPSDLFFNADQQQQLSALGKPELATLTAGAYEVAAMRAIDPILDNPDLREFWQHGETIPVVYPAGPVKMWYVPVKLGERLMVYGFTPLESQGAVAVTVTGFGDVLLDFRGGHSAYWVSAPPVVIPPPPVKTPADVFWESIGEPAGVTREESDTFFKLAKAAGLIP